MMLKRVDTIEYTHSIVSTLFIIMTLQEPPQQTEASCSQCCQKIRRVSATISRSNIHTDSTTPLTLATALLSCCTETFARGGAVYLYYTGMVPVLPRP
eukprot:628079-Rhodomonas_salina.1